MTLSWGVCTDRGRRAENEDSYVASRPVFVVADGMGGHEAGLAASRLVADAFAPLVGAARITALEVRQAIETAGAGIRSLVSLGPGPGSTVSGVGLIEHDGPPYWLAFNIGDSRVYRLGAGQELEQISVDHSRVQELLEAGELTRTSARHYEHRNIITRALGAGLPMAPEPDQWLLPVQAGDRMMVCSDGLTGEVTDQLIAATLLTVPASGDAAEALVQAALDAGGRDNVTVVVVDVRELEDPAPAPGDRETTLGRLPDLDLDATTIPSSVVEPGLDAWQGG